jgi:hypothetical protein
MMVLFLIFVFPSSHFVKNGLYMLQGKSVNILCISFNVDKMFVH